MLAQCALYHPPEERCFTALFDNLKVSLKDFLKYYRKKFIKRGFKLIVSTDRKNPLKYEQDLFVSFPNLRSKNSNHYDKDGNFTHSEV